MALAGLPGFGFHGDMPVPPRDVFENPGKYWDFLTSKSDQDFEGQFFDRKEAGRPGGHGTVPNVALDSVRDEIVSTISAFANKTSKVVC